MARLFVAYSRRDSHQARKLIDALRSIGQDVWVDWESIAPASDWLEQIFRGIENADAFLYLISPDAIRSDVMTVELARARINNKRIIPVVIRDVNPKETPEDIQNLNWTFVREQDNFEEGLTQVKTAIELDLEWLEEHRRLQVRALEWHRQKDSSLLLRGSELRRAREILIPAGSRDPDPTNLQRIFVEYSIRSERGRTAAWPAAGVIIVLLGLLTLRTTTQSAQLAQVQMQYAQAQVQAAEAQRKAAEAQVRLWEANGNYEDAEAQLSQVRTELANAQTQVAQVQTQFATAQTQLAGLETKLSGAQTKSAVNSGPKSAKRTRTPIGVATGTLTSTPTGRPTGTATASPSLGPTASLAIEPQANTPSSPGTSNQTQAVQATLDAIDSQFTAMATIIFNEPEQMRKEQPTTIELLLSLSLSNADLATQLVTQEGFVTSTADAKQLVTRSGEKVTLQSSEIESTPLMRAVLVSQDPTAFTVTEILPAEQVISNEDTTAWRWSVIAHKEGSQTLELTIYRLIRLDGVDRWRPVKSYTAEIIVEVTMGDRLRALDWKWFAGFILAAIGTTLAISNWLNHRNQKKEEASKVEKPLKKVNRTKKQK